MKHIHKKFKSHIPPGYRIDGNWWQLLMWWRGKKLEIKSAQVCKKQQITFIYKHCDIVYYYWKHTHMQTDMENIEYVNMYSIHDAGAGGCTFEQ